MPWSYLLFCLSHSLQPKAQAESDSQGVQQSWEFFCTLKECMKVTCVRTRIICNFCPASSSNKDIFTSFTVFLTTHPKFIIFLLLVSLVCYLLYMALSSERLKAPHRQLWYNQHYIKLLFKNPSQRSDQLIGTRDMAKFRKKEKICKQVVRTLGGPVTGRPVLPFLVTLPARPRQCLQFQRTEPKISPFLLGQEHRSVGECLKRKIPTEAMHSKNK